MTFQIISPRWAAAGRVDKAAPRTALATSGGALACAACCVLPIAFPAIALAFGGALLVWIDVATKAMFVAALLSVVGAWGWIAYRARSSGKRTPQATMVMLSVATVVLLAGLALPLYEPLIVSAIKG
jgi:hypothetical protein